MRFFSLAALFACLASASSFTYNDFSSVSGLVLNGSTNQSGNVLRLVPDAATQAGTAYKSTAISFDAATGFSTMFEFLVTTDQSSGFGAPDGFTFLLQNQGVTAVGAGGQGAGSAGISPSVAVVFRGRGPSYIGVVTNGADPGAGAPPGATTFGSDGVFYDQNEFAWIDYNPFSTVLDVYLSSTAAKPSSAIMSTTVDVLGTNGAQSFVGFSAGNGGAFGSQDILSWSFSSVEAPEPAAAGIFTLGLAALGLLARKFKR